MATILWDIENVSIPKGVPPHKVSRALKNLVEGKNEQLQSFTAIGNLKYLSDSVKLELEQSNVTLQHSSSRKDSAADIAILTNIMKLVHSVKDPSLHHIYIITGDSDFSKTCNFLQEIEFKVTLICNRQASPVLRDSASTTILWREFLSPLIAEYSPSCLSYSTAFNSNPDNGSEDSSDSPSSYHYRYAKSPTSPPRFTKSFKTHGHTITRNKAGSSKFYGKGGLSTFIADDQPISTEDRTLFAEVYSFLSTNDPENHGMKFTVFGVYFGAALKKYGKLGIFMDLAHKAGVVISDRRGTGTVKRNIPASAYFHSLVDVLAKNGGIEEISRIEISCRDVLKTFGYANVRDYLLRAGEKGLVINDFNSGICMLRPLGFSRAGIVLIKRQVDPPFNNLDSASSSTAAKTLPVAIPIQSQMQRAFVPNEGDVIDLTGDYSDNDERNSSNSNASSEELSSSPFLSNVLQLVNDDENTIIDDSYPKNDNSPSKISAAAPSYSSSGVCENLLNGMKEKLKNFRLN